MAIAGYVCRMQERTTSKEILPRTSCFSHKSLPSAVQSTSATNDVGEPLKSSISLSQSGFSFLQWPHQGAWNLMKTPLPAVSASQFSLVREVAAAEDASSAMTRSLMAIAGYVCRMQERTTSKEILSQ